MDPRFNNENAVHNKVRASKNATFWGEGKHLTTIWEFFY